jgi:arylsulfatase A-like enzyme
MRKRFFMAGSIIGLPPQVPVGTTTTDCCLRQRSPSFSFVGSKGQGQYSRVTQSPVQINGFTSSLSVGLLATAAISMCPAKGMAAPEAAATGAAGRPNFLILVTDDQSFAHTSFNGNPVVKTPAFDRVARNGVNFVNAFCSAPSCSPSRAAILTGRNFYELGPGAVLFSGFPEDPTFQDLLRNHGYFVGYTGKPWGPGFWAGSGRTMDPVGLDYNDLKLEAPKEISDSDYFGNFKAFLQDRPQGQPFSFWFGAREPHLPYAFGRGEAGGKKLADVVLPPHLVDTPGTRHQFLDYYDEIEWADGHLARMLDYLAEIGELDNTVVLVTSDNGLSMPRGKGDLYDAGVRMPLAVMWIKSVKGGRTMTDFVSLADIAPTVLELAERNAEMLRCILLCETSHLAPALEKFAEFGMVHCKKTTRKAQWRVKYAIAPLRVRRGENPRA